MSASGSSFSYILTPQFMQNKVLMDGFKLLCKICVNNYGTQNEYPGEFLVWFRKAMEGNLNIKFQFDCSGKLLSDDSQPVAGKTIGVAAHTYYTVLQSSNEGRTKAVQLEFETQIDKTRMQNLCACVDFASDFGNYFKNQKNADTKVLLKAAWCIAHELTVHVMPLDKNRREIIAAIQGLSAEGSKLKALLASEELSG